MTFLAPSAAIVGGAIAVTTLVLLYVLKLLRRPLRVSSVRFWPVTTDDTQVNSPFRAFRPSLLFFLHLLILALIVFAIGRPTIVLDAPGGARVLLLIDSSASMAARDPGEGLTRLERAKERGAELAATILKSGDRAVCVVPFAGVARASTGFTRSRGAAIAAIEGITQTDQPGDLGAALALASALLGDSESAGSVSIVLLSDGAFGASATDSGVSLTSPCPLAFERIGPAGTPPVNAGIVEFAARRDTTDPALIRVFSEVQLTAGAASTIAFTLAMDGQPLLSRTVEAPPPGSTRTVPLPITVRTTEGGVLSLSLGAPDALGADNTASVVIGKPASPRVMLVQPRGPVASGVTTADWLLGDVLEELKPAVLRRVSPGDFAASPPRPQDYDLVVLDRVDVAAAPGIASLSFGGELGPSLDAEPREKSHTTPAVVWDREHPALAGLSLDALLVEQRSRWVASDAQGWREIVKGTDGPLVVASDGRGPRRVAVLFELSLSNWPLMPEFPVFVAGSVDYLTMRDEASNGASTGTGSALRVTATGPGEIVAEGPTTMRTTAADAGEISLGLAERCGVYVVRGATPAIATVNLCDHAESELGAPSEIVVDGQVMQTTKAAPAREELWPYCLGALVALLMVEWLAFGAKSRV